MRPLAFRLRIAIAATLMVASGALTPAHAEWADVATISSTLGNNAGRLCMGGGRTDIGCPADAPLLNSAGNLLTVPTDLRVVGNLYVSGSQQFDGVTFANGGVSATGTISATRFNGDGSGITGIDFSANPVDRIVSGTAAVIAQQGGIVNLTLGGTPGAAYFHPTLGFVGPGVSTTGTISGTNGYFNGLLGVGAPGAYRLWMVDAGSTQALRAYNNMYLSSNNGTNNVVLKGSAGVGINQSLAIGPTYWTTTSVPNGNLLVEGDVGVGTLNPNAKMDVYGTISATNLRLSGNLYVSGSQTIDGVSFANGGISATGTVTATNFVGNGSGLTGIDFSANPIDRIVSGTAAVTAQQGGTVSLTLGGTPGAAYFHPALGYVGPGVSTTGAISATRIYAGNTGVSGSVMYRDGFGVLRGHPNFALDDKGNVGLGVVPPSSPIDYSMEIAGDFTSNRVFTGETWYGNGGGAQWGNDVYIAGHGLDNYIRFATATNERMRIVSTGLVGIGTITPKAMLDVSGTLRIANGGEVCDASLVGAIKYQGNAFYICQNPSNGWEALATTGENSLADRITSNSQAGVIANQTGYISLTTGGVTGTLYFTPGAVMVGGGVSTTGTVSATTGYFGLLRAGERVVLTPAITGYSTAAMFAVNNNSHGGIEVRNRSNGTSAEGRLVLSDDNGSSGHYVTLSMPSSGNTQTMFGQQRQNIALLLTGLGSSGSGAGRALALGTATANSVILGTDSTERMRITSTGLVGIGTSNPSATLHVAGDSYVQGNLYLRRPADLAFAPALGATNNGDGSSRLAVRGMSSGRAISFETSGGNEIANMWWTTGGGRFGVSLSGVIPSTSIHTPGSVRIGAETLSSLQTCDVNRVGAIKYESNAFYICQNTSNGWEALATTGANSLADRITSNSQAGVIANATGYISLTTGGVTGTVYFDPAGRLVNAGVSTTGPVSATRVFSSGLATLNGGILLNQGPLGTDNLMYVGSASPGAVDASMGFFIAGKGSNVASQGGYFIGRGNNYSNGSNQRGNLMFVAGYPTSAAATEGSIQFMTASEIRRMIIEVTGNIGIGTTAPAQVQLDVSGTLKIADSGETCTAARKGAIKYLNNAFYICQNDANGWEAIATTGANSLADRITSNSQAGVIANATGYISLTTGGVTGTVYFDPAGRLVNAGVSTTGPISGTAGYFATSLRVGPNAPYGASGIGTDGAIFAGGSVYAGDNIIINNAALKSLQWNVDGGTRIDGDATNRYLSFVPNSVEAMRIVSAGYVGIGTATPTTSLHVSGTLRIANGGESCDGSRTGAIRYISGGFSVCQNGTTWETLATTSSNTTVSINTGLSGSIVFRDEYGYLKARNDLSVSSTTGSVGIGAGAPAWLGNNGLYVAGGMYASGYIVENGNRLAWGDNSTYVQGSTTSGNEHLFVAVGSTEALRIVSTGQVGIGTSEPSTSLHVNGTLRLGDGAEACDANRTGAIRFESGQFKICRNGSTWEYMIAGGGGTVDTDRITSGTTAVRAYDSTSVTVVTGGVTRMTVGTNGNVGIGLAIADRPLTVSGTVSATMVTLGTNGSPCTAADKGTIKFENNKMYMCRD